MPDSWANSASLKSEPLSAEAERILASVPAQIGGGEELGAAGDASLPEPNLVADMMKEFAIEQEDVEDMLSWLFDGLASIFRSDHWKLTDGQAARLAKPSTKLLSALWVKLQMWLPESIAGWLESTPGAMGLMVAAGFIVLPRVKEQINLSRERAKSPQIQAAAQRAPELPRTHAPVGRITPFQGGASV